MGNEPGAWGSFRDPSGFVFQGGDGVLYRQVNEVYLEQYRLLMDSGLYAELVEAGLLIRHEEAPLDLARNEDGRVILRPEQIPFISYPYEWSFSQLKHAALMECRPANPDVTSG